MEMLYSPRIKLAPPTCIWVGMRMVSASQAWLGKAAGHGEALQRTPILPSYFCLTVGWGRKEEVRAVAVGGCVSPPNSASPTCIGQNTRRCRAGVISLHYTGGLQPSRCTRKGTLPKIHPFCPTFNLSQQCRRPAQFLNGQIKPVVGKTGSFGSCQ